MRTRPIFWVLALIVAGCGNHDTSPSAGDPASAPSPAAKPETPPLDPPAAKKETESASRHLELKALPVNEAGEPTGKPIPVTLHLDDTERVTGKFALAAPPLDVFGYQQAGQLRLWISGNVADKAPRRGYMVGTIEGKKAEGTFALSGNGGAPSVTGTWSSINKKQ